MGIYNTDSINILNEVYFGQTKGITKVFDAFCKFRDKYVTNRKFFMGNFNADHDPDLAVFCDEMEKEFNIESFIFLVLNSDQPNMYTLFPYFVDHNPERALLVTKEGYKFKKSTKSIMIILAPTGLLFNSAFTDREVFAIFLHEVGHNFQDILNKKVLCLNDINNVLLIYNLFIQLISNTLAAFKNIISLVAFSKPMIDHICKLFRPINHKVSPTIFTYFNCMQGLIFNTINIGKSAIFPFLAPIDIIGFVPEFISALLNPVSHAHSYYAEKMGDKFPVYYGFGPDLSTAVLKFEGREMKTSTGYYIDKIPFVSHILNTLTIPSQIMADLLDCHPGAASRIKSAHKSLENDLSDPRIPKSAKVTIQKEIDLMDKNIEQFFDNANKISNPHIIRDAMSRFIYASCGGDIKYAFSEKFIDSDKEVNNTYFKYINNESASLINKVDIK